MSRISYGTRGAWPPRPMLFHRFPVLLIILLTSLSGSVLTQQSPCLRNPCQNDGRCDESVDAPGGYQCICPEPYGGKDCTIENPVCKDEPCLNRGTCEDLPNQQFRCYCPQEYSGLRCEFKNPCLVKPCKNGAECLRNNLGTRECRCLTGFTGEDCGMDINECEIGDRSPCENNGTCINEPGGYRCECLNGYTGAHCEVLVLNCKPNPCQNGGVCEEKGDHFECTCPPGYEGNRCQTEINDCKDLLCQNGGMCEDLVDGFRCTCLSGWKGPLCEERTLPCDSSPCLNNGVCFNTPNGSYLCQCLAGFNGTRCEVDMDDCVGVHCENGGHCVDGQNSWSCQCPPGFTGRYCGEYIPVPIGATYGSGSFTSPSSSEVTSTLIPCIDGKSCLHEGICVRKSFCECPIQWHGAFCEIPVCPEDACANGGHCREILIHSGNRSLPSKKDSYCDCPPGFFGDNCLEVVNWCLPDLCQNGECVDLGGKGARCHCNLGFGGNRCEHRLRSCLENPCLNGANCSMDPGKIPPSSNRLFTCQCQPGFMGDFCESQVPCHRVRCGPNGRCEADQCICNPGWGGAQCNVPLLDVKVGLPQPPEEPISCDDSPCANHAQCLPLSQREASSDGAQFRCLCETALGNFTGQFCHEDIDECTKEPCQNGGKCENTRGSFVCRCSVGFEGRFCEARGNPCDDTYGPVCANGGICSTVNGNASCRCPPGFSGLHCETEDNECAQKPCLNGGVCVPFFGSYACRCPTDFSGRHCERSLAFSPCSNQTCQNGGYCSSSSFMEECHCPPGFYGRYCEVTLNLCHQLLEINLSTDIIDPSTSSLGHPLGNRQTLSLVAATSALLEDSSKSSTSIEVLNSLHLSKTSLGPCYPPGTQQCLPRRISGDFECQCRHGFVGRYCEQRRDFCAEASQRFTGGRYVCLNGGQCINRLRSIERPFSNDSNNEEFFVCQCPPGFSGPRCELRTRSCDDVNICQNGGICDVEGSRLKCICPRGLGGTFCEVDLINECEHGGNCLNGGKCVDGLGNYTCECLPDFCGARCELMGFACALEATTDPKRWPGEAVEARLCKIADCKRKAGNGHCDPECDRFACGFDAGECLYSNDRRPIISPMSMQRKQLSKALPWANCTVIQQKGIPCHLLFGDGKCDSECDSESCLFDGWDCGGETQKLFNTPRAFSRMSSKKPVEGSLILLLGIPPSELLPENDEKRDLKHQILDGLGTLLKAKLRIRQQPNTGAPMVYPVPLAMVQKETSAVGAQRDTIWSLTDTGGGVNVSVNRLIMDQDVEGYPMTSSIVKLSQVLAQITEMVNKSQDREISLSRKRRDSPEIRLGSRVFLEFQEDRNRPMDGGSSFKNVETAAQFVSAALRTRRYTPPVDIFSVETATPEALQQIISEEETMGDSRGDQGLHGLGLRGTLIYCLIALLCGLVLLSLFGVLYRIVQRHSQAANNDSEYRSGQKGITKMIKTTSIWYPRNSSTRDTRQGGAGAGSGVFNCFSGLAETEAPAAMSSNSTVTHQNIRNMATPRSSNLRLWTREQALARGREKMALRSSPYPVPPSGYSQVCAKATVSDASVMNTTDVPPDTPLLMARVAQMPQVDVKAYFTSLMECLVSGNGVTEPFTEGFAQKLDYLRSVEVQQQQQQQQSEASSTIYRGGSAGSRKRTQTHSLLHQLLTCTLPETGETLLHLAARYNCANALSSLLIAGADPYAVDAQGSSVLLTAVNASAVDTARALLVSPQIAADMPRLFVACPTEDKTTALIQAVKVSDIEMVELLLQTMASLIPDAVPLQLPSGPGGPLPGYSTSQMMQNRRLPGIDSRLSYSRLYPSTATGNTTAGTVLMNPGNSSGDDGSGPSGLSTNSFGVNATDGEGRTALHWAALTEQPAMVQLLLRAGASHDVQTVHEETPLTFAAREGSVEICSLLLAAGANIEIADYLDRTPKQLAAANGHTDVVQLLQVYSSVPQPSHHHHSQHHQSPGVIPTVQQPQQQQQQHRYTHRAAPYPDQSFFQPQQQQQRSYRHPVVTTASAYSDGPSYEKHPKIEPPDYPVSGAGESFLMQLDPTTSSTDEGIVATTTGNEGCDAAQANSTSKAYFFDQPPLPLVQQQFYSVSDGLMTPVTTQSAPNSGGGGGGVNRGGQNNGNNMDLNWTVGQRGQIITNSAVPQTNGHTPSSDTESPAHWSSPSPTAISPPLAPPKMTLASSGQYQVSHAMVSGNADPQVCCPNHGGYSTSTANGSSGEFPVVYSDDCIKLEPSVF